MWMVLGNILCYLDPRGQGHIMYFLVNPSSPKLLDIAASNFAGIGHIIWRVLYNILRDLDH